MATKDTINRLRERIDTLVTACLPVRDVVVWRHPGETEAEALERYMREHPKVAMLPPATVNIHVVSWEG